MSEVEHASGHPAEVVAAEYPHERPEDWGWHADLGKPARIAGWLSAIALLIMTTATHYNLAGTAALILTAAAIAGGLLIDVHRRKTAWRR
jgi:Protein of unknown function (DUF2631)